MNWLGLLQPILAVIDKVVPDKEQAQKIKYDLERQMIDRNSELAKAAASIIKAEIASDSPAARNWRPHLMYFLMGLIAFNGVVAPLIFVVSGVRLPLLDAWQAVPDPLWDILLIGMGGYVFGRSVEKSVRHWREGDKQ